MHSCLLIYLLAVYLLLTSHCRWMTTNLRVILRLVGFFLSIFLLILLVHHHHVRVYMAFTLTLRVVIANIVDVLLTDRLHVQLTLFLWMDSTVLKSLLLLCWLLLAVTIHLVTPSEIRMVLDLWCGHHDSRGYLASLVLILRIIVLWYCRAHSIIGFIDRYLAYMSLWDNAWPLILIQAGVPAHSFNAVRRHGSVPWRCEHLVSHINVGWRRV